MWDSPVWWEEMVVVPWRDGRNPQLLAKCVAVACELSQVQFAQASDSYWVEPLCLSVFEHECYMPKLDTSLAIMDIHMKVRDKMLIFACILQEWAEQLWNCTFPGCMVQSVYHLQTHMQGLVDFTLDDVLPVLQVEQVSELKVWPVPVLLSILELAPRLQQEDLSSIHLEEDKLLMEGQNPSPQVWQQLPNFEGQAWDHPHVSHLWQPVLWCLSLGKLSEKLLPAMVEPVALYSALVYRDVVTRECCIMTQTLQLQEQGALDQSPGAAITEL